MKKVILSLTLIILYFHGIQAQINLIGSSASQNPDVISIVKWQSLDSSSITSYPTPLEAYLFGSSVFDSWNGNYYLTGISADTNGLLSFNSGTNTYTISGYTSFSNITEIDMSTGKIYNLTSDSIGYFSVNEYDIRTGTDSLLGVIYEPGILGIIADATGFDSNNGILYYVGYDNSPNYSLYAISVRSNDFSYTKTVISAEGPGNNFTGLNYDNINNTLFALNARFDSTWNYTGSFVVEIDKITGDVITKGSLAEFPYFVAGSSSFDQNSGSLLLVGIDSSFAAKMIVFDTYTNSYQTGYVPGNVSEIVCDNSSFARSTYTTTSVRDIETTSLKLYPNPAGKTITLSDINTSAGQTQVSVFSMNGQLVFEENVSFRSSVTLDISSLKSGTYLIKLVNNDRVETRKLIVNQNLN
ncbi:MAG: T9SS type A sorting domain-containing protein [Lentimicrobium sp.]